MTGLTITEKILAAHAGRKAVEPGEFIEAKVDIALGNDITAPLAIEEFGKSGAKKVFDRKKVVLVPDHFTPNKDLASARQAKVLRDFAREQNLKYYFDVGRGGIEHALLPEQGLIKPGDVIIGADSHTCTYGALGAFSTGVGSTDLAAVMMTGRLWFRVPETIKFVYAGKLNKWVGGKDLILYTIGDIGVDGALYRAMEFSGKAITNLSQDSRFSMCNMAIEAGAKSGIVAPDEKTLKYLSGLRCQFSDVRLYKSDKNAKYCEVREYDCSQIEPQVSLPHLPSNTKQVTEVGKISLDQVVIGSCTNGRIEDLRIAARLLKGKKIPSYLRLIIIPATQRIYLQAAKEGLIKIFLTAGGVVTTPTCGPCLGGHMGVLAEGEKVLATTNRNFRGRMGHPTSEVYLAGPAVAAASAVRGRIAHPAEIL
jgi:3-isopropylmalate/(R)-2-methylmalate dehydratase large subunit